MALKDLLPKSIYDMQKELFRSVLDGGKRELKKRADDIYILQKDVFKDLQKSLVDEAEVKAVELYYAKFDVVCEAIKKNVPYIGGVIVMVLQKYKDKIVEAIL